MRANRASRRRTASNKRSRSASAPNRTGHGRTTDRFADSSDQARQNRGVSSKHVLEQFGRGRRGVVFKRLFERRVGRLPVAFETATLRDDQAAALRYPHELSQRPALADTGFGGQQHDRPAARDVVQPTAELLLLTQAAD